MIDHIRDYKIVTKLGEGGMGTVYLADDVMLERKVAIKVLNPILTKDAQFTERFRHEAKVQASLIHPNLVTLYNYFQEDDHYCMVMEYVDGITLKHLVSSTGPIPEQRAIWILSQMLEAVGFAHKKGIIHRDIKPSNVLLGKDDTVKILDFGIAKILQDKGLTKTGTKMGTIYYMSPEQIKAVKDIDHRTDIYSIGVTFYEMLSGRVPFNVDTESDFEIMNEIVQGEIKDPRQFYPNISDWVVKVLFDSVVKDRDKRIQTSDEFTLRLLAKGEATKTTVPAFDKTVIDSQTTTKTIVIPPPLQQTVKPPVYQQTPPQAEQFTLPKTPVQQVRKKSSALMFSIFGIIGVVIIVAVYFLFIQKASPTDDTNLTTGEEPWVINKDYGNHFGPAKQEFREEDRTINTNTNWQAKAQKPTAASK